MLERHGHLTLQRLFFVANVEPVALPDRPLAVLADMKRRLLQLL